MIKKFKAVTGFYAFMDYPMIRKDTVLEFETEDEISFKFKEYSFHKSWLNNWIGMGYIKEITK
jgi:hypothetical protein